MPLRLTEYLKAFVDAGSIEDLIPLDTFINDQTLFTKTGSGVTAFSIDPIDDECLGMEEKFVCHSALDCRMQFTRLVDALLPVRFQDEELRFAGQPSVFYRDRCRGSRDAAPSARALTKECQGRKPSRSFTRLRRCCHSPRGN
jgi:hypothetical protein